jgi:hypothetical protein
MSRIIFSLGRRALMLALLAAPLAAFGQGFSSDRISVLVQGEGRDVILVPGLGSSPRVWAELVKASIESTIAHGQYRETADRSARVRCTD